MPIILPTIPPGGRSPEYNLSDYSHSTVFTVTHTTPLSTLGYTVPALTTVFTAPSGCENRWLVRGSPWGPTKIGELSLSSVWDIYKVGPKDDDIEDPWYQACQAYSQVPAIYSPGMCPDGQTVAEITEHQTQAATGIDSYWQASCCPSGMGFGKLKHARCQKTYSSSTMAYFPMTSKLSGQSAESTFYEATTTKTVGFQNKKPIIETSKQTSVTTLAGGYAIADPVVVAWQKKDLDSFPASYASSLARQIGIPFTASSSSSAAPGTTPTIPGPTRTPESTNPQANHHANKDLNFASKVGIIIGSIGGLIVLSTFLIYVLLHLSRRRRRRQLHPPATTPPSSPDNESPFSHWWRARDTHSTGAPVFHITQPHREMPSTPNERLEMDATDTKKTHLVELESPATSPLALGEKKGGAGGGGGILV